MAHHMMDAAGRWLLPDERTSRQVLEEVVREGSFSPCHQQHKIYHLNLLKLWNEQRLVELATSVIEEGELGLEAQKVGPFT